MMINNTDSKKHSLRFENTDLHCPVGEKTAKEMMQQSKIPVISCEGYCIRGDIARMAANMLARENGYGRACHGEIFAVPQSGMAEWARKANKLIVIDGCFLHCHGRMIKSVIDEDKLAVFDALSYYKKYTDIMEPTDIPEVERKEAAQIVFNNVVESLSNNEFNTCCKQTEISSCCDG